MAKPSITCKSCGARLEADTVEELATMVQKHENENHGKNLTYQMALEKAKEAQEGNM